MAVARLPSVASITVQTMTPLSRGPGPSPPAKLSKTAIRAGLLACGLCGLDHRVHILVELKQGQCICPLNWSVHCNFTDEGKCNKRGWACTPHPHQPGPILPSWLNVRQKAAVATLCTLWFRPIPTLPPTVCNTVEYRKEKWNFVIKRTMTDRGKK